MSASIILGYLSVFVFSLCAALGATFMKVYSKSNKKRDIFLFMLFYGLNVSLMFFTLKYFDLILVFNVSSIVYVFSLLFGKFVFKEEITRNKIIGVVLIIVGTVLIGM